MQGGLIPLDSNNPDHAWDVLSGERKFCFYPNHVLLRIEGSISPGSIS